jgi:signal transduction histidine kinase
VRIRGVYWQASSPTVLLPSKKFIEIREPAPRDPFDVPVFPIDTLRALNSNPETLRRMKVAGVVTCRRDDFFLAQDSSGGIRVATALPSGVKAGDAVEIVGFPSEQALGTVLHEALVRRTGNGVMPAPVPLSMDEVMDERNSGRVVASEAVLLEQRFLRGMQSLDLQAGQRVFRALLPASAGRLPAIAAGSRIRVSGVSQIERAERSPDEAVHGHEPLAVSMALHLRTPADVIVLQRPPWWNWKHTAALAGFAAVGLGGALIWITMLRQRVDQRTHELRDTMARLQKETQISATLAERDRLAGEIHDSLEQGLSAILMQMDAATKVIHQPDKVAHYLDMTRNMAAFSRAEVQHAVWDLQSPLLENADLATALRRVAGEISAGDTPRVTVDISGPMRPLPSTMEHHLLRIGQEAITNAVKHAQPKTIRVALDYDADRVSLAIHDDGCGFNPQAVTVGSSSHFGLQGLRTRARKLDASLTISSKPGEGTNIKVVVPLEASGSPANSSLDSSQPDSKL